MTTVEIKIGIQHIGREVGLETNEDADAVVKQVETALTKGTLLDLTDVNGRRVLVPGERIAYLEIGDDSSRRVGFGAS